MPELVPFRLTRNMVDGMGPTGTEGTFARAAEATTRVLRDNSNALLTILSAIASDPLYRFTGKQSRFLLPFIRVYHIQMPTLLGKAWAAR